MTRSDLVREVRALGLPARAYHVERAVREYWLDPEPSFEGPRRVYLPEHVSQVARIVRRIEERRRAREAASA